MTRLYDENSKYTDKANALDGEVNAVVAPIIARYVEQGYCPRDIQNVAYGAILDQVLCHLIKRKP